MNRDDVAQMIPDCGGEYHGQIRAFRGFEPGAAIYFSFRIGNNRCESQLNGKDVGMSNRTSMTRRGFLGKGVAAAGTVWAAPAIVPASALGAEGGKAPSERINVGMIGVGRQAYIVNLKRQFLKMPDVQIGRENLTGNRAGCAHGRRHAVLRHTKETG